MSLQFGTVLRNNRISQLQTTVGASAILKIFSGAQPANPAAADPAGLLATITLPATFLTSAAGVASLAGSWTTTATGTGTALSFRLYDGSAVCHIQGSCSGTGGGGDMTIDNPAMVPGQTINVLTFAITDDNV